MKKFVKKALATVLCVAIVLVTLPVIVSATSKSQTDALNWAKSQVGKTLDYDGAYGGQCVDFIMYYYTFLGVNAVGGNGCDYATNSLPSGWSRVKGGTPQPGDILVYSGTSAYPYGHVAIYESDRSHYHQNVHGQYVEKITSFKYNAMNNPYWGYIRPNWSTSSINYSSISTGYYTLTNVGSGKILDVAGGVDADQTNIQGGEWWNPGNQRLYISPASTGYKMRPVCSSSRLVNAWGDNPGNGANVNIYKDCNESSQWWLFEKVSNGYVVRLAYNTSLVLTYWASSNNVAVATYSAGDTRQIWKLEPSNTYTVTYNANGGSGAPGSQTKYQGRELTLSATIPTKSGYTFNGWNTKADGTGTAYAASGKFSTDATVTLYAQWKSDTYTLTYDANGGSGAPAAQTMIPAVGITIPLTVPVRTGYTFTGWNTRADGEGGMYSPGTNLLTDQDETLYAQWKANTYTVTFNSNGGNCSTTSKSVTYNSTYGTLPIPTREGYTFDGWFTSQDGGIQVKSTTKCTLVSNMTLYAHWTKVETTEPTPTPTVIEEDISLNYKDAMTFSVPVTLESSNTKVASVSENKITAVGTGSTDVTATLEDGTVYIYHINVSYSFLQWIIIIVLFGWIWY
ncbi:MAG: InlB B-repeat-containing protein [Clostridia bacterium]|nr:InlB B-repeat-containing protein [Clostridia bacterium]